MKVKRQARFLKLTKDYVVIDCRQQALLRCRKCGLEALIVITSQSHQLRWCSHCVGQLTLTSFDETSGNPTKSRSEINKWVDNGSVQLIETGDTTFIITFRAQPKSETVSAGADRASKDIGPDHGNPQMQRQPNPRTLC